MNRFDLWIASWIDIAVGIVGVLSLGAYRPLWDMNFCVWAALRHIDRNRTI